MEGKKKRKKKGVNGVRLVILVDSEDSDDEGKWRHRRGESWWRPEDRVDCSSACTSSLQIPSPQEGSGVGGGEGGVGDGVEGGAGESRSGESSDGTMRDEGRSAAREEELRGMFQKGAATLQGRREDDEWEWAITPRTPKAKSDFSDRAQREGSRGQAEVKTTNETAEGIAGEGMEGVWGEWESQIPDVFKTGSEGLANVVVWRRIMRLDSVRMNSQWVPFSSQQDFPADLAAIAADVAGLGKHEHLSPAQLLHAARLVAVLEAYAIHDPEIGYCQGMADLASPFVALHADNSDAFWSFVRFMDVAGRHNFRTDERGIRRQLRALARLLDACDPFLFSHLKSIGADDCMFAYRMVIVMLRYEMSFEQTLMLWDVLWAEKAGAAAAAAASATSAAASKEWQGCLGGWEGDAECSLKGSPWATAESESLLASPRRTPQSPVRRAQRGMGKKSTLTRSKSTAGGAKNGGWSSSLDPWASSWGSTSSNGRDGALDWWGISGGFGSKEDDELDSNRPPPSPRSDFFLFVVAAVVMARRKEVLECTGLDGILALCNNLSSTGEKLDVWALVDRARRLVTKYEDNVLP